MRRATGEEKGVAQRRVCVRRRLHATEHEDVDRYSNRNTRDARIVVVDLLIVVSLDVSLSSRVWGK